MESHIIQKVKTQLPEIYLVGVSTRTTFGAETDPESSNIAPVVQRYLETMLSEKITHRANPGVTYSVYTEGDGTFEGEYTYFIGEEVTSFDSVPEGFVTLTIPEQTYMKFSTEPGEMPDICIETWEEIWDMQAADLSGERVYIADFEVYDDERAEDPLETALDIYIGIKS